MLQFSLGKAAGTTTTVHIISGASGAASVPGISAPESDYLKAAEGRDQRLVSLNRYNEQHFVFFPKEKSDATAAAEALRKGGAELAGMLKTEKAAAVHLVNHSGNAAAAYLFAQGLALAVYQFLKYRSEREKLQHPLTAISFEEGSISPRDLEELSILTEAAYRARDLVNEPLNALNATGLAEAIKAFGQDAGFSVQVLEKEAIEQEGMGGILAVNRGSQDPPTFSVMEYNGLAGTAQNGRMQPIVLVGKGVVYDTGGLSLKPTPNSMDRMKSDMSGAALVSAAMWAIAKLRLPLHVIALVPSTDNRPGENAYVPGDIITMYSGTTVEVLNTDAEGRLLLGDALHWAKRYSPALVLDFATLTGAASVAVGEHGIVCMGTADEAVKAGLRASGERQYERLVEYPLWDEYGEQIKSEVADIKNVGGPNGGAITAGKFLQRFVDYPWMHFDIAGVSFATAKKAYIPTGGTAYGLRMLMDFLKERAAQQAG